MSRKWERKKFRVIAKREELEDVQEIFWPYKNLWQYLRQEKKFRIDMLFEQTDESTSEVSNVGSQGGIIEVLRLSENKAVVRI